MIAALPMYDFPAAATAHNALWAGVRDRLRAGGVAAPEQLNREISPMESWAHPDLLLGQICNLPLRARFDGAHTVLGCADHALPGMLAGFYHSVIVVRAEHAHVPLAEALKMPLAYNEALSHSGWGSVWMLSQELGVSPSPVLCTGAHANSVDAVADGQADVAAIDVMSWLHLCREKPETKTLSVIGRTAPSPGMTFITARHQDSAVIRTALRDTIENLAPEHKATLGMFGFLKLPPEAYALPIPPHP